MSGVVYFLKSASGKIKVGFTTNLVARLGAYRTNSFEAIEAHFAALRALLKEGREQ